MGRRPVQRNSLSCNESSCCRLSWPTRKLKETLLSTTPGTGPECCTWHTDSQGSRAARTHGRAPPAPRAEAAPHQRRERGSTGAVGGDPQCAVVQHRRFRGRHHVEVVLAVRRRDLRVPRRLRHPCRLPIRVHAGPLQSPLAHCAVLHSRADVCGGSSHWNHGPQVFFCFCS